MRSVFGREALFSGTASLLSALIVQTLYATVIRPRAAAILALPAQEQTPPANERSGSQPRTTRNLRSVFVILKDYEQETALILACWATLGLGVTFNATLTALVACILVMFFLHQLQQAQDRLVLDARL